MFRATRTSKNIESIMSRDPLTWVSTQQSNQAFMNLLHPILELNLIQYKLRGIEVLGTEHTPHLWSYYQNQWSLDHPSSSQIEFQELRNGPEMQSVGVLGRERTKRHHILKFYNTFYHNMLHKLWKKKSFITWNNGKCKTESLVNIS